MLRLNTSLLPTLSFSPDEPVLAMHLDQNSRSCVLGVTRAYAAEQRVLHGVRVEIAAWQSLDILQNDVSGDLRAIERLPDELADLCEFEVADAEVRIAGFCRKADGYYQLAFRGASLAVEYVEAKDR